MKRELNFDPTKTVLIITVGFLIIYLLTDWTWPITVSLVIGLIGIFSKKLSEFVNYLWIKLTVTLSYIVPNIVLAIIYFIILVPIALISRIFRKEDELLLKEGTSSTFFDINRKIDKESLRKMW